LSLPVFRRKVIVALTVREIFYEHIAKELVWKTGRPAKITHPIGLDDGEGRFTQWPGTRFNPNSEVGSTPAPGVARRALAAGSFALRICKHLEPFCACGFSARARKTAPGAGALPFCFGVRVQSNRIKLDQAKNRSHIALLNATIPRKNNDFETSAKGRFECLIGYL